MKQTLGLIILGCAAALILAGCEDMGDLATDTETVEADGAEAVEVNLKLGAGELRVSGGAQALMEAEFTHRTRRRAPEVDYRVAGSKGFLSVRQRRGGFFLGSSRNEWDIRLNSRIPAQLDIDLGAGESRLDLTEIDLRSLTVDMGVGEMKLDLRGRHERDLDVSIDGGIGSGTIYLPREVGVRVRVDGGIGSVDADEFERTATSIRMRPTESRPSRSISASTPGSGASTSGSTDLSSVPVIFDILALPAFRLSCFNGGKDEKSPPSCSHRHCAPLDCRLERNQTGRTKGLLTAEILAGFEFRNIGPAVMSGRVSDIVIHPGKRSLWYVAVGSGNIWKTENAGTTWTPIFDGQASYSIGCLALDPSNPDVVWAGTGENVSGRHVGFGDGVYRSLNGGKTWTNMGLTKSEHIARILVDPRHPGTVYAAAEGPLWSSGGERGLYKTTDGGKAWALSLEISRDTGVTSAEFDPSNPDVIYAAAYQRRRSVAAFMGGGPESAIYKSEDAGKTWRKLTVGLPGGEMGKIGLAVSPIQTNVVYATVESGPEERGFYRSTDRGESWEKRNSMISGGTGTHYYQEIFADPNTFDRVYQMAPMTRVTDDGGKTWRPLGEKNKHVDNHALAFVKGDPGYLLEGCDGGVYETHDSGKTWRFFDNLPVTQFYKLALDNALPFYNVHGGTQDNGSQLGPSRTLNAHGIRNSDWVITFGADGYACAIDSEDPNILYVEMQEGNLFRYDKKSQETTPVSPTPGPDDPPLRFNWDSPVRISPHSHTRVFYASQFLWRSDDRGDSWTRVSPDLTRNIFRLEQPIMSRTWSSDALWDHGAMSMFSTITTVDESRLQEGLIYAGTDDGFIQVTEDGGKTWRKIDKITGLPDSFFVNKILASKHERDVVFAAVDSHKSGDYRPYLLKSTDRGKTWTNIARDLPQRNIVWSVAQDNIKKDLLFAGTEFGIYATLDGVSRWLKLGGGVPTISFRDIEVQEREGDLVGASFGRGFFILDDYSPLRQLSEETVQKDAVVFPVKKALQYIPLRPIDSSQGMSGRQIYTAPNPPFGAVFTYYLKDSLRSAAENGTRRGKRIWRSGKPVSFAG
jgi:photosystem II stability/assembly factor-like uncharacterized protein